MSKPEVDHADIELGTAANDLGGGLDAVGLVHAELAALKKPDDRPPDLWVIFDQ